MDDFGINRTKTSIRAKALEKLAQYAANESNDFQKLSSALSTKDISAMPMSGKEFEVLLSLANSAQYIVSETRAHQLMKQLGQYLIEAPTQVFVNSPIVRRVSTSPWQVSTKLLSSAIISLGNEFESLKDDAQSLIQGYLKKVIATWNEEFAQDLGKFFPFIFSFQGFLEALASKAGDMCNESSDFVLSLIKQVKEIASDSFLLSTETAISSLRACSSETELTGLWVHSFRNYANQGHQSGAMLISYYICEFFKAVAKTFIETLGGKDATIVKGDNLIDWLSHARPAVEQDLDDGGSRSQILKILRDYSKHQVDSLDDGADYIELASPEKIDLALQIKAIVLEVAAVTVYHDYLDLQTAIRFVESSMSHEHEISHEVLSLTVFKFASFLCFRDETVGPTVTRYLPLFLLNPSVHQDLAWNATLAIVQGLKASSQDVVVSLIYTLINMLTPDIDAAGLASGARSRFVANTIGGSTTEQNGSIAAASSNRDQDAIAINGGLAGDDRKIQIYRNVVNSIVAIANNYGDNEVTILTSTVLSQKLNSVSRRLDHEVLIGLSKLAVLLNEREFKLILKAYTFAESSAFKTGETTIIDAILTARCNIAKSLQQEDPLYEIMLADLLSGIISKGDVQELEHHRPHQEISANANEIAVLLPPLAELLPSAPKDPYETGDFQIVSLFRNAWFNMVVHGFSQNSQISLKHTRSLQIIARSTPPLVSESSSNKIESELDLNTVLRRGSSHSNVSNQKEVLGTIVSQHNFDFRTIPYPKLMFLAATALLESMRVSTGNCSKVLLYFGDPGFRNGDTGKYMANIAVETTKSYITNVIRGGDERFTVDNVAEQLKEILMLCCHRVKTIQNTAFTCADMIIRSIPAALCKQASLFTLMDLLTLLWTSCLDSETDEYEPRAIFVSPKSKVRLELSDSYDHRQDTLDRFLKKSKSWVRSVMVVMNYNVKSLLTGYLASMGEYRSVSHVALGCTFAVEMGSTITKNDGEVAALESKMVYTDTTSGFLSQYIWRTEFKADDWRGTSIIQVRQELEAMLNSQEKPSFEEMRDLLFRASSFLSNDDRESRFIVRAAVKIPFRVLTERSIQLGISLWLWAINEAPQLKTAILSQVATEYEKTVKNKQGIYSRKNDHLQPEFDKMEYAPSNKAEIDQAASITNRSFAPHVNLIRFLSSVFQASTYESKHTLKIFTRLLQVALTGLKHASLSSLARSVRFELVRFGLDVLAELSRFSATICDPLKNMIIKSALTWFKQPGNWPFGGNRLKLRFEVALLKEVLQSFSSLKISDNEYCQSHHLRAKRELLVYFLENELTIMSAWLDPLQLSKDSFAAKKHSHVGLKQVQQAWTIDPELTVYLVNRYQTHENIGGLESLVLHDPVKVVNVPYALKYFSRVNSGLRRYLIFWAPVSPIESISMFLPQHGADSIILQYAMRALEYHDVNVTFFYVPQIVQSLRYDKAGYVERYILETAKLSQLFAHQIIWNVLANGYTDEDAQIPDVLKPTLDDVVQKMTDSFNEEERSFYRREFEFFENVTSISGKLKPFIKKTKAEKKAKIDEEINKIKVDVGVYLPSNPDGEVVDIDRHSGKPLQSHAKAPFLATFKIRKEVVDYSTSSEKDSNNESERKEKTPSSDAGSSESAKQTVDVWQSAIFKVGDDVRQDVLALQLIAVFRSIFKFSGLDLYVYPNRVTATAPWCGVIDVLPNSISRDMLGREAVNGLYEYFTTKFGGEDSIAFQRARNNFVKSLAAYSVISYLIQFKDRHNGNIMYDNEGHILHIDFGFCFDIVPGGVKFEAAPFKLTHEMVQVMGGSTETQAYRWFEELCVKAFLSCRPHSESIIQVVLPMLESGLPCFKGEATIKRLRSRFALEKSERDAALHFRSLIRRSYQSIYTKGYDEFQRITNGIPY